MALRCTRGCLNSLTHLNIQCNPLRKLVSEFRTFDCFIKDSFVDLQRLESPDLAVVLKKISKVNETIVRICEEFASVKDIVNIYHFYSKSYLSDYCKRHYPSSGTSNTNGAYLSNYIYKGCNLKFTLFSLEEQCIKLMPQIYPYQIVILLSSHLRMGRFNQVFFTCFFSSFAKMDSLDLNHSMDSRVKFKFYNPNTLSLLAHIVQECKGKGIDVKLLDRVICFVIEKSRHFVDRFTPLDTITLGYALIKYQFGIFQIGDVLLQILTHGTNDINVLEDSIGKFENFQQLSLLANVLSKCFPVTKFKTTNDESLFGDGFKHLDKLVSLDFKLNMWNIILHQYFKLLMQFKMDCIDFNKYRSVLTNLGVKIDLRESIECSNHICEKLTNSLVSFSKVFELDYSSDLIVLDKTSNKSKRAIYRIYRLIKQSICCQHAVNQLNAPNELDFTVDTIDSGDLFYGIYGKICIFSDIVCKVIENQYLTNLQTISPQTLSNSLNALSCLHIQQYDFFKSIGDCLPVILNKIKFSPNEISLICNSFANYKFQHQSLHSLISQFIAISYNFKTSIVDFYHVILALRKFGIYSHAAAKWVISTCTNEFLNLLNFQGLGNVLCYLMTYNFYRPPLGYTLTHYLSIIIGKSLSNFSDPELISQYKISSLIYHTFAPQVLDVWFREVDDLVSGMWIQKNASQFLYNSLLIDSNLSVAKPSNFAHEVADTLACIGYKVSFEHKQGESISFRTLFH